MNPYWLVLYYYFYSSTFHINSIRHLWLEIMWQQGFWLLKQICYAVVKIISILLRCLMLPYPWKNFESAQRFPIMMSHIVIMKERIFIQLFPFFKFDFVIFSNSDIYYMKCLLCSPSLLGEIVWFVWISNLSILIFFWDSF